MNNNEVRECEYCHRGTQYVNYEYICYVDQKGTNTADKLCKNNPNCIMKQLLQLKAENEQLTQKLEKARGALEAIYNDKYQYTCDYSDCTCWDLAQQALKELEE